TEMSGGHIAELPVIVLIAGMASEAGREQLTFLIELIARHAKQPTARLHCVDMHELRALAVPEAALAALGFTGTLCGCAAGLGNIFGPRGYILADQDAGQHQHQHGLHHRHDDARQGHARGSHDGQLTVAGQGAEPDQTADQCRHGQHFMNPRRRGEQHISGYFHQTVATLDVAQLVNEGKQQRQTDDNAEHRQDRQQYMNPDVAIQLTHEPPLPARYACDAAAMAPRTTSTDRLPRTTRVHPTVQALRECGPCPWSRERQSAERDKSYKGEWRVAT